MNRNRLLLLSALAVLSACKSNPTGPTVTQVTVTPSSSVLTVGGTQQFSAAATDASGNAVTGGTVTWASSDTQVATVTDAGLVSAVAAGQAAITATISGVAGSAAVTVSAGQQPCENAKTVSLAVGGSATYDYSDCIILPSGASGDRYRVAVTWPAQSATASDVHQMTLSVTGLGVTTAPPAVAPSPKPVAPIPAFSDPTFLKELRMSKATERFHGRIREREAEVVRRIGTTALLPSLRPGGLQRAPAAASPAKRTFTVDTAFSCVASDAAKVTGILVHEDDNLAIYQDSAQRADPTKSIPEALAQKMTEYYASYAKDMVDAYWGPPSDVDGNGKVLVLATAEADSIAAYVYALDMVSADQNGCATSNEAEVIYFNTGLILDMQASKPGYQALSTVAHEMKHVVGMYDRIASYLNHGGQFNPLWIEEGTAEISGEMSSRIAMAATGGPSLTTPVTHSNYGGGFTEENYGIVLSLARTVLFLSSQPNGLVVVPDGAAGEDIYGPGWLSQRWLGDAYGNTSLTALGDSAFFRAFTDSLAPGGVTGLEDLTGTSFDTLLDQFYTTIMLHGTGAPPSPEPFLTYDFVSATTIFSNPNPPGDFPWPVTLQGGETPTVSFQTADYAGPIGASGIRIHDFLSNGTGTGAQIRVNMAGPGTIIVVRLR